MRRSIVRLCLADRRELEDYVRKLWAGRQVEAMAEAQSPDNIASAYRRGLQAAVSSIDRPPTRFLESARILDEHLSAWAIEMRPAHYGYIRVMKNPKLWPSFSELWDMAASIADFSLTGIVVSKLIRLGEKGMAARKDIQQMAAYLSEVQALDTRVENYAIGPLIDAL